MARALTACGALALLGLAMPAIAQALADPTRPPAAGAANGTAAAPGSGLEAVLISPTRKSAVIDGRVVHLGESYGGARLVEVTPTGVVLRDKQASRTLRLNPGVTKSPAAQSAEQRGEGAAPQEARR